MTGKPMKIPLTVALACFCLTDAATAQQVTNPVPNPIVTGNVRIRIDDLVQMPATLSTVGKSDHSPGALARINFLRESPDGRLFVNDLRGQLYTLDVNNQPQLYLDLDADNGGSQSIFPATWYANGLAAGFISFNFHPEFATNGIFYTIHMERASDTSAVPDFSTVDMRNGSLPVNWHTVITEWTAADPLAPTWNESTGSRREVLRVGTTADSYFHPYGDLQFNPLAGPGDDDYGMLYVSGGDWGYINGAGAPQGSGTEGQPGQLQRLDTLAGTLLRIDPRSPAQTGGAAGIGDYTVPSDNPFVDGDPNTLDEIYAFGFRNGHRMAWDTDDGQLYVMSVGHANLEEIERVLPGGNYGWGLREGTFVNGNDLANGGNGDADNVFVNNVSDAADVDFRGEEFLYPVVQYDHGEGNAIAGGFVYRGADLPQLQNKYIFGDIVNGRVFVADIDDIRNVDISDPSTSVLVEEVQLYTVDGNGVETDINDLRDLVGNGRADLRFGLDSLGEIYVMTKTDGFIRKLVSNFDLVWNVDGGGNWSVGGNWLGGSAPTTGDDVGFGSVLTAPHAPASINLDVPASVTGVTFNNSNPYVLTGANTLTLTGPAQLSAGSGAHEVGVVIAGTAGLTKTGDGTVTLAGAASTYSGDTTIARGTLALSGSATINNSSHINVTTDGTFDVTATTTGSYALNNQTLTIDGNVTGNIVATNGSTVHVNSTNSMNGNVTVQSGSLVEGAGQVNGNLIADDGTVRVGGDGLDVGMGQFLIEDFESFSLGDVNSVANPPWTAHASSTVADIEDDGSGNNVLTFGGTSGFGAVSRPMPEDGVIDDTEIGTFFFRFNSKTDDPDHSMGLADQVDTGGGFVFDHYEAQVRVTDDPGATGTYLLNARDGNDFSASLATGLVPDSWYNIWMVIDQTTDTYDVYMNTGAADANAGNQIGDDLVFRNTTTTDPLFSILGAWGPAPIDNTVRYDTLAFLDGFDLTNPLGGLNPGLSGSSESLTVDGDFTMSAAATLELDIVSPDILDLLSVTGHFSAAGALSVALSEGAPAPQLGDMFDILDFASAGGAFDMFSLPSLSTGLFWKTSNLLATGILEVVSIVPGDADGDGDVDLDDYNTLSGNMYTNVAGGASDGDFDEDGDVDFEDFVIQSLNFGDWPDAEETISSLAPEPASVLFLLFGAFCLRTRRRVSQPSSPGPRAPSRRA